MLSYSVCEVEDVVDQIDAQLSDEEDVISDQNKSTEIRGEIRRTPVAEDGEIRSQSFIHYTLHL